MLASIVVRRKSGDGCCCYYFGEDWTGANWRVNERNGGDRKRGRGLVLIDIGRIELMPLL